MTSLQLTIFPFRRLMLLYKLVMGDANVKVDNLRTMKRVTVGKLTAFALKVSYLPLYFGLFVCFFLDYFLLYFGFSHL